MAQYLISQQQIIIILTFFTFTFNFINNISNFPIIYKNLGLIPDKILSFII